MKKKVMFLMLVCLFVLVLSSVTYAKLDCVLTRGLSAHSTEYWTTTAAAGIEPVRFNDAICREFMTLFNTPNGTEVFVNQNKGTSNAQVYIHDIYNNEAYSWIYTDPDPTTVYNYIQIGNNQIGYTIIRCYQNMSSDTLETMVRNVLTNCLNGYAPEYFVHTVMNELLFVLQKQGLM